MCLIQPHVPYTVPIGQIKLCVSNTAPMCPLQPKMSQKIRCVQYSPTVSITAQKVKKKSMCSIQPNMFNTVPFVQYSPMCLIQHLSIKYSTVYPISQIQPKINKNGCVQKQAYALHAVKRVRTISISQI